MKRPRAAPSGTARGTTTTRAAHALRQVRWSDVRGLHRLANDATLGVVGIVEAMHHTILRIAPPVGAAPAGRTRGITGLVYRSIGGVTRLVGAGVDAVLAQMPAASGEAPASPARDAALAALNGVLGDHLAATANPLALPMRVLYRATSLEPDRDALAAALPAATPHVVLLVHGLCMGPAQWSRHGHDHGAALARDLGAVPLYLHYNTGRHISENGRELATVLDRLLRAWPHPIARLTIVGHSMGGLVARSACHYAHEAGHAWLHALECMVFLGTPHQGAPLERLGTLADGLLEVSPYAAPFARLGKTRSAGVRDLGHSALRDEDWQRAERGRARASLVPLPAHVRAYALAACQRGDASRAARLWGDGLVPVASALGNSSNPARALGLPPARQRALRGLGHFDLLDHPDAYSALRDFVGDVAPA